MVATSTGSSSSDPSGLSLMVGDSHTASVNYGLDGLKFTNVPKSKFLFYIKFFRPTGAGGVDWLKDVSFSIKNIDRPRVTFKTELLNQYNRKRLVQTSHEFEPLQLKFHDTVNPALRKMFVEYYQYYYGDSKIYGTGGDTVYDIVAAEGYNIGKWGFQPPQSDTDTAYFFSHVDVYQLYAGQYEKFTLINPKITSYNPDDMDYSAGTGMNEIQISMEFEGIVYADTAPITAELATEFGIDRGQFWDVPVDPANGLDPNSGLGLNTNTANPFNLLASSIQQATSSISGSINSFVGNVSGAYDAAAGLVAGTVGLNSVQQLVNGNSSLGNISNTVDQLGGLFDGSLSGGPGGLF